MTNYFTYESAARDLAAVPAPRREADWLARIRARVAIFREENATQKASQIVPSERMSPERGEMLRQILGLPDARNVTAE